MTKQQLCKILYNEIVKDLAQKNIVLNNLPKTYIISRRSVYDLKAGNAGQKTMHKVADYFDLAISCSYAIKKK